MKLLSALLFCGMIPACHAGEIGAPLMGLVFDAEWKAVRPILGIPGAAVLSGPIDLGFTVPAAWVSPRQDYVLAVDSSLDQLRLLTRSRLEFRVQPVAQGTRIPEAIIFSPRGTAAALWRSGTVQIIKGLPDSPTIAFEASADQGTPAAVSDDGRMVILLGRSEISPAWLVQDGASALPVDTPGASAAAFRPGSHDAVLACRSGELWLLNANGVRSVVEPGPAIPDPVGAAFSADGKHMFLAGRGGQVASLNLDSGQFKVSDCGCRPTGLFQAAAGMVFRINEASDKPVFLFDGTGPDARVWFVPTDQANSTRSGQ